MNQRFLESITPLVKQAVELSVSAMVVSGLSGKNPTESLHDEVHDENEQEKSDAQADVVDPDNPNIVTTHNERQLFDKIVSIIGFEHDIQYKDTASYFGVLFRGKTNRWIVRYYDKKSKSSIQLPIDLNDITINEISRAGLTCDASRIYMDNPEDILRISGLVLDSFEYVKTTKISARSNNITGLMAGFSFAILKQ